MKPLIATDSELYLKRLAKDLKFRDSMYDDNGRIYAFEGAFTVADGKLMQGARVIDTASLRNGHGESIVASHKP